MGNPFKSKKKTYVFSSANNLAGDPEGKPSYLKTAVAGGIFIGPSVGESIKRSYLKGPGINLRNYIKWCERSGYKAMVQMQDSGLRRTLTIPTTLVRDVVPLQPGESVEVITAERGFADPLIWVNRYLIETYQDDSGSLVGIPESSYDVNDFTATIYIGKEPVGNQSDTRPTVTIPLTDYSPTSEYVYALYRINTAGDVTFEESGPWVTVSSLDPKPDVSDWSYVSGSTQSQNVSLRTRTSITKKYHGGGTSGPTHSDSYRTEPFVVVNDVHKKVEYIGSSKSEAKNLEEEETVVSRVYNYSISTETTKSVVTQQEGNQLVEVTTITEKQILVPNEKIKTDVKRIAIRKFGLHHVLIYRIGSGNAALDGTISAATISGDWAVPIPFRIDNKDVDEFYPAWGKKLQTATKRAFQRQSTYPKILDALKDNESINDISYANVIFGVALDAKAELGRRYIYYFFKKLIDDAGLSSTDYARYMAQDTAYRAYQTAIRQWEDAQQYEFSRPSLEDRPTPVAAPVLPEGTFTFASSAEKWNFSYNISWNFMYEDSGIGRRMRGNKPAKIGAVWWEEQEPLVLESFVENNMYETEGVGNGTLWARQSTKKNTMYLYFQETANTWKRIVLIGAVHHNNVHKGHLVKTTARDAVFKLTEEDGSPRTNESGFIVPINLTILKNMGIVGSSELIYSHAYMVVNSYKVVKIKWYQRGIFKVILVVVIIVVAYFTGGAALAEAGGLLGTNASVGASLGFAAGSGAAIIAGAIANAIAAMIVMQILSPIFTKIFGEVLGNILLTIGMFLAGSYASAAGADFNLASAFSKLFSPENLMKLSMSGINGLSDYLSNAAKGIMEDIRDVVTAYEAEARRIQEMYFDQFGDGSKAFDPIMIMQSSRQHPFETPEGFLSRTLMTGMDIADITNKAISNFAAITLSTNLRR